MKKALSLATGIFCLLSANAGIYKPSITMNTWDVSLGIGATHYQGMIQNDGTSVVKRVAIAYHFRQMNTAQLGLELGAQDGNLKAN